MQIVHFGLLAAMAALAVSAPIGSAEAKKASGKCVLAKFTGVGPTDEATKEFTHQQLAEAIRDSGRRGVGKVMYACDHNTLPDTCTARQKACK